MKKILLFPLVSAMALSTNVFAQNSVTATWTLKTDNAVNITGAGASDITSPAQVLGTAITSVSYGNKYDTDNTPTNDNWQKIEVKSAESSFPAAKTANFYTEYKVIPSAGKYFQLNSVSVNVVGTGGSTNRLVALYSLDGFATSSPLASTKATYKTEGDPLMPTLYDATEADPVSLINVGNTSTADLEGREVLTFSALQINVNPSQTLSVRFYYFQTGTGNRFAANKNIVLTGKTDSAPIPLPLDFLSFKASMQSNLTNQIKLDWFTSNEINTHHFIIERRQDGGDFKTIGLINSLNSSGIHHYTFLDLTPLLGVNYYRLKQVDNDGGFKYSNIVYADNKSKVSISSYPNPVSNEIHISHPISRNGIIQIFGINGAKLNSVKIKDGATLTSINVSQLKSGIYSLTLEDRGVNSTVKFIKE